MDKNPVTLCDLKSADAAPAIAFEEGKGHVSVNPVYGCNVGCPFCINQADPWRPVAGGAKRSGRAVLASALEILDALERDADTVSQLKLSLMDFCDPFEPALEPTLRHLLCGINDRLPDQAVLLTTRLAPRADMLRWMAGLRNLRLSLFVSMGDACGGVPPVTPVGPRLDLLSDSARQGLHTVMLLRPLVQEWTDPTVLRRLLEHAAGTCHEVVLAGLSLAPVIEASLRASGWPVPACPADAHGGVDPQMRRQVLQLADEVMAGTTPLSEHRSCAVNRHLGLPCKVAQRELGARNAERGGDAPGTAKAGVKNRLESAEWRALSGDAPLRIKACSCFGDIRDAVTTRACIGYCRFDATTSQPVKVNACGCFLDVADGRPRDRAGYCLLLSKNDQRLL